MDKRITRIVSNREFYVGNLRVMGFNDGKEWVVQTLKGFKYFPTQDLAIEYAANYNNPLGMKLKRQKDSNGVNMITDIVVKTPIKERVKVIYATDKSLLLPYNIKSKDALKTVDNDAYLKGLKALLNIDIKKNILGIVIDTKTGCVLEELSMVYTDDVLWDNKITHNISSVLYPLNAVDVSGFTNYVTYTNGYDIFLEQDNGITILFRLTSGSPIEDLGYISDAYKYDKRYYTIRNTTTSLISYLNPIINNFVYSDIIDVESFFEKEVKLWRKKLAFDLRRKDGGR